MAQTNLAMLKRLLVGAFAYFQEDDETYNVSNAPDVSASYEAVPSLGCIEQVDFDSQSDETEFLCPKSTGGYERTMETRETADYLDMQCQRYSEIVHRLQFGLSAEIVEGSPVAPFAKKNRKLDGWLCVDSVDQDGETVLQMKVRVEVRLNNTPPWQNDYGKPTLRFQILDNSINVIQFGEAST